MSFPTQNSFDVGSTKFHLRGYFKRQSDDIHLDIKLKTEWVGHTEVVMNSCHNIGDQLCVVVDVCGKRGLSATRLWGV